MYGPSDIRAGMVVRSPKGRRLGEVVAVCQDGVDVERLTKRHEVVRIPFDAIDRVEEGQLRVAAERLRQGSGSEAVVNPLGSAGEATLKDAEPPPPAGEVAVVKTQMEVVPARAGQFEEETIRFEPEGGELVPHVERHADQVEVGDEDTELVE